MKNITDIVTKRGFVGAGFKPARGGCGTNQAYFLPQGGFVPQGFPLVKTRPYRPLAISSSGVLHGCAA